MTTENHAKQSALSYLETIVDLMAKLKDAREANDDGEIENLETTIQEMPLSVEVRSNWNAPGGDFEMSEFRILLCTGGPAVQITGDLGRHFEPCNIRLEYQDWCTPWTPLYICDDEESDALVSFCQQFYFGE